MDSTTGSFDVLLPEGMPVPAVAACEGIPYAYSHAVGEVVETKVTWSPYCRPVVVGHILRYTRAGFDE